jgi:thiol-disulfide isomerase/thioredoxin
VKNIIINCRGEEMIKYMKNNWGKILVGVLVASFALLVAFSEKKSEGSVTKADVKEWIEKVKEDKYTVTVLTLSYCDYCKQFLPVITEVQGEYGFDLYKFEIDTISETQRNTLTSTFEMKNFEGSVPYTVIYKNGKYVADNTGYIDKAATIKFLKDNGVITE